MPSKKIPLSPLTVLMIVIVIAAIASWFVKAGKYEKLVYKEGNSFSIAKDSGEVIVPFSQHTLDSLGIRITLQKFKSGSIQKPVSIPGTYHTVPANKQGVLNILQAPIKGIYDSIDIILFLLFLGGFISLFEQSGAMTKGLQMLSHRMKGKEKWLIVILTFLFSLAGSSYGMAEEAFVFYPLIVPLFVAAGFDLLIPVAVIFGGTQLGSLSSFSNPFSTIIASNAAGISWTDGINGRIFMFILSTAIYIFYILRYAAKVKKDPTASFVYQAVTDIEPALPTINPNEVVPSQMDMKTSFLLFLFLSLFVVIVGGVITQDWWFLEMTTVAFTACIILAFITRMKEHVFIKAFIKGAENILGVALIVGVARGITYVMNSGNISDTILYYSAALVSQMPPAIFIVLLLCLFIVFTLFISSSSGMAVLTMPIMGALAFLIGVPGREIVNAYLFGMGIMGFITPSGLVMPSLAIVNVSLKAWWKFIAPFLLILFILCSGFLIVGIALK